MTVLMCGGETQVASRHFMRIRGAEETFYVHGAGWLWAAARLSEASTRPATAPTERADAGAAVCRAGVRVFRIAVP